MRVISRRKIRLSACVHFILPIRNKFIGKTPRITHAGDMGKVFKAMKFLKGICLLTQFRTLLLTQTVAPYPIRGPNQTIECPEYQALNVGLNFVKFTIEFIRSDGYHIIEGNKIEMFIHYYSQVFWIKSATDRVFGNQMKVGSLANNFTSRSPTNFLKYLETISICLQW